MVTLVTRGQWTARPPRDRTPLVRSVQKGTAVHYTAADSDRRDVHAECAARVRSIQDYHLDVKGWADIAYSYLACRHGYLFEGRGTGIRTAAQGTTAGNDAWHAVCFLGADRDGRDDVTDSGRRAIRAGVERCNAWSDASGVRPHSSFHATACPGDELRRWIAAGMPVTHEEDVFMALTDAEQAEILRAARQINQTVAKGQVSFESTVEAILGGVQMLVNLVRDAKGSLAANITDLRSALLGAIAAQPGVTDEQAAVIVDRVLAGISQQGVEISPDAVLEALRAHPLAPTP